MKTLLAIALIFAFVFQSFASVLIYKIKKEVKDGEAVELATIDVSKYKQIRIYLEADADKREKLSDGQKFSVAGYGIEDGRELFLFSQYKESVQYGSVFDTPPPQIKIRVKGATVYYLYVWGTQ